MIGLKLQIVLASRFCVLNPILFAFVQYPSVCWPRIIQWQKFSSEIQDRHHTRGGALLLLDSRLLEENFMDATVFTEPTTSMLDGC
jgi:hypothetical protein